jgi:aquaporin Z
MASAVVDNSVDDSYDESYKVSRKRPNLAIRATAEFLGTFFIVIILLGSATWDEVAAPDLGALQVAVSTFIAYAAITALFARVSGAHFNPAVTIASALVGGTKILDAIVYIVVQVVGGFLAAITVFAFLPVNDSFKLENWVANSAQGFGPASAHSDLLGYYGTQIAQGASVDMSFSTAAAIVVQIISALIAIGVVISHSHRDGTARRSLPIAAGLAYAAGILITWPITGDGNNPARTTGYALAAVIHKLGGFTAYFSSGKESIQQLGSIQAQQLWLYWLAPVIAAALVAVAVIITRMVKNHAFTSEETYEPFGLEETSDTTETAGTPGTTESVETETSQETEISETGPTMEPPFEAESSAKKTEA